MSWFKKDRTDKLMDNIDTILGFISTISSELYEINNRLKAVQETLNKMNQRQMDQDESIKKLAFEMKRRADKSDEVIAKYEQVLQKVKFTEIIHKAAKSEKEFIKAQKKVKLKAIVSEPPRMKRKYTKRAK